MDIITMREFAAQKGVTYEAIRRQVARHEEELRGHIVTKDRTKYLDEYAQKYLSEHRRLSPVVTKIEDNQGKVDELEQTVESLRARLLAAQDELLKAQQHVIELQADREAMLEAKAQHAALIEENETMRERLRQSEEKEAAARADRDQLRRESEAREAQHAEQVRELEQERDQAKAEAGSFEKSWFGFYRKK